MKITTIKKMQSTFVGKICTILSRPIAKSDLSDQQFSDFFTGVVDEVDDDGIFTTHTITGCKNFYRMQDIVGVIEEQVLDEDNTEHKKIINDIKEKKEKIHNDETIDPSLINIDELTELANSQPKGNI